MHRRFAAALVLSLSLTALARADDVSGTWKVSGNDRSGKYRGTATLAQDAAGHVTGSLALDYVRWNWSTFSYVPTGKKGAASLDATLSGTTLTGRRFTTVGVAGALSGATGQSFPIVYHLASGSLGGRYDGSHGRESFTDQHGGGSTPPATQGGITVPTTLLAVPGTPEAGRADLTVQVDGAAATLTVSGPARLLRNGAAITAPVQLQPGSNRLQIEGTGNGAVSLSLTRGGQTIGSATTQSNVERLYLLLEGYQGEEIDYLDGDMGKVISNIAPRLTGYTRIEDGKSFDQAKIDRGLADTSTYRRVVIDWCTTREDLFRYLRRGTLRGIAWGSHGFMEPWPNCPDSELGIFESRVWSATAGAPANGDAKNFMREWRDLVAASARTHGKLDFVLMHSCCTGGIGSYAPEVWHYITPATQERCVRVLGDPLPDAEHLRYSTFTNGFSANVGYLKTFVGPSYFGLSDVNWSLIAGSLQPTR